MRPGGRQAKIRANIFMAREVFFRDVLRIRSSDISAALKEHRSGIKQSSARSSRDSTPRLLNRFVLMMNKYEFNDLGTSDKLFWTFQKQMWCADAQC